MARPARRRPLGGGAGAARRHPTSASTLSEVARRCTEQGDGACAAQRAERPRRPAAAPGERYSLGPRLIAIGDAARRGYTGARLRRPGARRAGPGTGLWARAWRWSTTTPHRCPRRCPGRWPAPSRARSGCRWRRRSAPVRGLERRSHHRGVAGPIRVGRRGAAGVDALPAIRRRGFAVTLASPEWRELSVPRPPGRPAAVPRRGSQAGAGRGPPAAAAGRDRRGRRLPLRETWPRPCSRRPGRSRSSSRCRARRARSRPVPACWRSVPAGEPRRAS